MRELIDRQEAIEKFAMTAPQMSVIRIYEAVEILESMPTIQPERKKGEWLPDNNNAYEMRFVCSCCKESEVVPTIGFTKYKPLWDFCPNCGADMRGKQNEL